MALLIDLATLTLSDVTNPTKIYHRFPVLTPPMPPRNREFERLEIDPANVLPCDELRQDRYMESRPDSVTSLTITFSSNFTDEVPFWSA